MKEPSNIQQQAISHLSGPAQVIAGPGSGKTYTLVSRILHLIREHHISPGHILVITYTRAAATEMKERFTKSLLQFPNLQHDFSQPVHFGTFHSICYQILKHDRRISSDSLIKDNEKKKLLKVLMCNHGWSDLCGSEMILALENEISRRKNNIENKNAQEWDMQTGFSKEMFSVIRQEYDVYLKEQKLLDFDDMIVGCHELFLNCPNALEQYRNWFRYILVDEFQDINQLQYQLLKLLAAPQNNLFVVGDDDQAIYGFRGAAPGIMKQFAEDFPQRKELMLTENYRSGEKIVAFAEKLILPNKNRFPKTFVPVRKAGSIQVLVYETRTEEEEALVHTLSGYKKEALCRAAIILRTNREVLLYSQLFANSGIALCQSMPKRETIFQSFIMEDIAAFLSYLYMGGKRSDFLRFMNKPNRFLSPQALVLERVREEELFRYYSQNQEMLGKIEHFFRQLQLAGGLMPYMAVSLFRKTIGYDGYLQKKADDHRQYQFYLKQADQIQQLFWEAPLGINVPEFLQAQVEKTGSSQPAMQQSKGLHVLTMHGAKGLEFDKVFLPDVNQGIIPPSKCSTAELLEEERRLLYVAVTRARNSLTILYTKERNRQPSIFLKGLIPPQ